MPRIPKVAELSSVHLDTSSRPAQIDERVAEATGRAGRAWGDAIAAVGGAFGEVAGRMQEANDAAETSRIKLDWMDFKNTAWNNLSQNAGEDGAGWANTVPTFKGGYESNFQSRIAAISDPKKRDALDFHIKSDIANMGFQGARNYQAGQAATFDKDLNGRLDGAYQKLTEQPSQEMYDSYSRDLQEYADAGRGRWMDQATVDARKKQIQERLLMGLYGGLVRTDPEAADELLGKIRAGKTVIDPQSQFAQPGASDPEAMGGVAGQPRSPVSGKTYPQRGSAIEPSQNLRMVDRTDAGLATMGGVKPQGIVFHHTAGSSANGAISALRERGLSYNFLVDKDGSVIELVPPDAGAKHMRPSQRDNHDLSNANSIGISFVAQNNGEVTDAQRSAGRALASQLAQKYGINKDNVFGHGEVNGHKEADEGKTDAEYIRQNGFASASPQSAPRQASAQIKTSQAGIDRIKQFEGSQDQGWDYQQFSGPYGVKRGENEQLTLPQAEARMRDEVAKVEQAMATKIKAPLNQNQHDSLVSFFYNLGTGKGRLDAVADMVNNGRVEDVPAYMRQFVKAGGETLAGLEKRREEEATVFASPVQGQQNVPLQNRTLTRYASLDPNAGAPSGGPDPSMRLPAQQDGGQQQDPADAQSAGQPDTIGLARRQLMAMYPGTDVDKLMDANGRIDLGQASPESRQKMTDTLNGLGIAHATNDDGSLTITPSGGQTAAQLAQSPQAAQYAAQIHDLARTNPTQKLTDAIDDHQLDALMDARPDLADRLGDMTVKDASMLLGQLQGHQRKPGQEFPRGPFEPGQVFEVNGKNGPIRVRSEDVNAITPKALQKLDRDVKEAIVIRQREGESQAQDMMQKQLLTVERTGKDHSQYDPAMIADVYRRSPEKVRQFNQRLEVARMVHEAVGDAPNMHNDQLESRLMDLQSRVQDANGDADPEVAKALDRAEKKVALAMKQRTDDPGAAVQNSREVQAVIAKMPSGEPKTPADEYSIADARMKAQVRLGIAPSPITRAQADAIVNPITFAQNAKNKRAAAEATVKKLSETYGDLAPQALSAAVRLSRGDRDEDRSTLDSAFKRMQRGTQGSIQQIDKATGFGWSWWPWPTIEEQQRAVGPSAPQVSPNNPYRVIDGNKEKVGKAWDKAWSTVPR